MARRSSRRSRGRIRTVGRSPAARARQSASIRAAANPARNDFVYYVVKPCANGAHSFSSTDAQFQRDVAAYNRKRDELGGKDPSQC